MALKSPGLAKSTQKHKKRSFWKPKAACFPRYVCFGARKQGLCSEAGGFLQTSSRPATPCCALALLGFADSESSKQRLALQGEREASSTRSPVWCENLSYSESFCRKIHLFFFCFFLNQAPWQSAYFRCFKYIRARKYNVCQSPQACRFGERSEARHARGPRTTTPSLRTHHQPELLSSSSCC